ncbi:hypothetical protein [Terrisporobacter mayombei]|nr:hypothetical protein [Terrisporobacter mayombei]
MDEEIKNEIFQLINKGLLIDFSNIYKYERSIRVDYYVIGHYGDMYDMYNNLERNKYKAKIKGTIEHKNKKWNIYNWD